jgi:CO dehydrogenase/acetyl-CoA synthase epsilon subunit
LYLRASANGALTAEQVSIVITALVKIDVSNLRVTGPFATRDPKIFKYTVYFCTDDNIDSVKSADTFNALLDQGNTGGLDVAEEPVDSTTGETGSAATVAVSFAVMIASFALLL